MSETIKRASTQQEVNTLNVRVTALESTNHANHSEMMRILTEMNSTMKETFKEIKDDLKLQSVKQQSNDSDIVACSKEISRVDSKLTKIMSAMGALLIAAVTGFFGLVSSYIGR